MLKMARNLKHKTTILKFLTLVLSISSIVSPVSSVFEFLFQNKTTSRLASEIASLKRQDTTLSTAIQFSEKCDANNPCDYSKFLECIDGKCMCLNPIHHAYDEDAKVCVSLAGSGCSGNGPKCVRNSQCSFGACQCLQNYSQTTAKVCLLGRGKSCQPNECNGDLSLACISGTCQCIDSLMVYQPFSGRCFDPQEEFGGFARTVGKAVAQRVFVGKISGTVLGAHSLLFLPVRLLIPGLG